MDRSRLLDKIRALMSKTTDNGCTEQEALAALDKARAMMDAYEVTEADLQLTKEQAAVLRSEPEGTTDPHGIKRGIASAVAKFCDCKVWRSGHGLTFCGLKADAQFATWLTDHLAAFVQGELMRHLTGSLATRGERRLQITGFVGGCCARISERLNGLCVQSAAAASPNSKALVVAKQSLIAERMAAANITLGKSRRSARRMDAASYAAGKSAGDRASFGRPITGQAAALRLK